MNLLHVAFPHRFKVKIEMKSLDSYVSIDIETSTGGDPDGTPPEKRRCSIVQIGAVKMINGKPDCRYWDVQLIKGRGFDRYNIETLGLDPIKSENGVPPEQAL